MRVYVPATLPLLSRFVANGSVPPGPAHAVTAALRAELPDAGDEEWEYAALTAAAHASAAMLRGDAPRRRVVIVAEVPEATESDGTGVELGEPVPMRLVQAVHADTDDVDPADDDPGDLGWFASQEIPALIG